MSASPFSTNASGFSIDDETYGSCRPNAKFPYPYVATSGPALLNNFFVNTNECPTWNVASHLCPSQTNEVVVPRTSTCFQLTKL